MFLNIYIYVLFLLFCKCINFSLCTQCFTNLNGNDIFSIGCNFSITGHKSMWIFSSIHFRNKLTWQMFIRFVFFNHNYYCAFTERSWGMSQNLNYSWGQSRTNYIIFYFYMVTLKFCWILCRGVKSHPFISQHSCISIVAHKRENIILWNIGAP